MKGIYSATYSNVPVYEFNCEGHHVMRRRSDDWINATHILKVADFDKPARTRILEREVQKGTHEKVQGGYGKYQGTWIPLEEARLLAERNKILEKLRPIFDFVPGERSPPPAPKHSTAAAGKPKPRQAVQQRRVPVPAPHVRQPSEVSYDGYSQRFGEATPDDVSMITESEDDPMRSSQFTGGGRKRKRNAYPAHMVSYEDQEFVVWADSLLDFFMLQRQDDGYVQRPEIPPHIDLNRGLDNKGFTAMHWAAAMGDVELVRDLQTRGARVDPQSPAGGETPLMRSVMFTNNFDRSTMQDLILMLHSSVGQVDYTNSNVFHHIANSTSARSRYSCARYYLGAILDFLSVNYNPAYIIKLLDQQDRNGDTPVHIAARNGARKCVRMMVERGAHTDIENMQGEVAAKLIHELNARRRAGELAGMGIPPSSSPIHQPNGLGLSTTERPSSSHPQDVERPAKKAHYSSDAASLVASQLPDLLSNRVRALAELLEEDLKDKDKEAREAEFLLEQRKAEVQELRRRNEELAARYVLDDEAQRKAMEQEVQALFEESRALHDAEMAVQYNDLLRHEVDAAEPSEDDHDITTKLRLVQKIRAAEKERETVVAGLLEAIASSGSEEKQILYRRVIGSAMGMEPDKIDEDLPDIIDELVNVERRGGAGAVSDANRGDLSEGLDGLNGIMGGPMRVGLV